MIDFFVSDSRQRGDLKIGIQMTVHHFLEGELEKIDLFVTGDQIFHDLIKPLVFRW